MRLGAVIRPCKFNNDPIAIRDFVQAAGDLGYAYLSIYDLVTASDSVHAPVGDPFVTLAYLAAITDLEIATVVVVLPSRQTVLFAKQAATLDSLSGGRLRLGVSVGWNQAEYQAMGVDFRTRGKRIEEQITILRKLWTKPSVTFKGTYHNLENTGIDPLPVQRPIPLWIGGHADLALRRVARLGDGWLADSMPPDSQASESVDKLKQYLVAAGRKPDDFDIGISLDLYLKQDWVPYVQSWRDLGVTHVDVNPTRLPELQTPQDYINAIRHIKETVTG